MKKHQAGFSLVMALVSLALVTSGTFFIMELKKEDQRTYAISKNLTYTEQEKKRISAILADSNNCTAAFGGKGANATFTSNSFSTGVSSKTTSGVVFLTVGTGASALYYKTIQLVKLQTRVLSGTSGQIILTYQNDPTQHAISYVGKASSTIVIPMYMNVSGGNIVDCYATTTNTQLPSVIASICAATGAATYPNTFNYAYMSYDSSGTVVSQCTRETVIAGNNADGATLTCGNGTALTGIDSVPVAGTSGNHIEIPASKCSSFASSCSGTTKMYSFVNSSTSCDYVAAGSHDTGSCSLDQATWWNNSSSVGCGTMDCRPNGTYSMIKTVYPLACYTAPSNSCPAGQYVRVYNSDGTVTCDTMPVISGNCAPGFAIGIVRSTGGAGSLTCSAYTKTKSCASPSSTTYVQSFTTGTTANCAQF